MANVQHILGKQLRLLQLDVSQPGGQACIDRLRPNGGSLPWLAAIDSKGKIVASGDRPTSERIPFFEHEPNILFPESPVAVRHFLDLLRIASPGATDVTIQRVADLLGYPDISQLPTVSSAK